MSMDNAVICLATYLKLSNTTYNIFYLIQKFIFFIKKQIYFI